MLAFALGACVVGSGDKPVADTTTTLRPTTSMTPVNDGTYGMSADVRWLFSPDSANIIVVVDPYAVEADPVADGFFVGIESNGFQAQVDSVWDVAPSPDWKTIAFSRAYVISQGESETVAPEIWQNYARITGLDTATLRASSFSASGMAYARGIAQPAVIRIPADPRATGAAASATPKTFPVAGGWRVRWTTDGTTIGLGNSPTHAQDDSPAGTWAALDARTGSLHGSLPSNTRLVEPKWNKGPTVGFGIPIETGSAPSITVRDGTKEFYIESQGGIITLRDPSRAGTPPVAIGPGMALAATRTGRYVLALAPRTSPKEYENPLQAVVYTVIR